MRWILVRFAESLISSYFNIVRKNFMDLVPKTIMCFLVNQTKGVWLPSTTPPPPAPLRHSSVDWTCSEALVSH